MEIPLFPLHTVLCPGIALPLHVFEPRYRLLTERCIALDAPFGVVLIREGREVGGDSVSIAGVGTLAEIRQATRYPDGRYDLLIVGSTRFAVEAVETEREPYLVGTVTTIDDELGEVERTTRLAARTMGRFVDYLHLLQPLEGETAEEIDVRVEVETEAEPEPEIELDIDTGPTRPRGRGAGEPAGGAAAEDPSDPADIEREARLEETARRLVIPEDPTVLSYLLSGIIQVDSLQRQVLLEASTTEDRLEALAALIDRELWLLRRRLRHFTPDQQLAAVRRN
jgi:Lon protease-like protein